VVLIQADRLNTHRLGVINLPLCLKGALFLLGWTRRSMKNRPLEMRWKRSWGKRNEWSLRNGNEYFPKPCGAEVGEMN